MHFADAQAAETAGYRAARNCGHDLIPRSRPAKERFEQMTGYPHCRPGYVVDHVKPLACGGADDAGNMQWQTIAEARAKAAALNHHSNEVVRIVCISSRK